jgi:hypothetical protein
MPALRVDGTKPKSKGKNAPPADLLAGTQHAVLGLVMDSEAADTDHVLRQIETVLKGTIAVSGRLRFRANPTSRTATRQ